MNEPSLSTRSRLPKPRALDRKGVVMKRIAKTLVAVSLVTACSAMAGSYPSSADETIALSDVFPNITTHQRMYRDDGVARAWSSPASPNETTALSDSFPSIGSYAQQHSGERMQ